MTQSAITEYRQYLKNKDSTHSELHNTHLRTIPNDLINGDKYDDPLKIIHVPKQRQNSKTAIEIKPLPEELSCWQKSENVLHVLHYSEDQD